MGDLFPTLINVVAKDSPMTGSATRRQGFEDSRQMLRKYKDRLFQFLQVWQKDMEERHSGNRKNTESADKSLKNKPLDP